MKKKIGVAVIGCGAISKLHLDAIKLINEAELLMVCDKDEQLAQEVAQRYHCKYTTDYRELLSSPEIDLVHILTPHYLHTPMAIEALEAGKKVVLEKPIGISLKEISELKEAETKCKGTIAVIFQNRYNPISLYLKQIVGEGNYGPIKAVKGILTWFREDSYYSDSDWRGRLSTEGGGLLINQAIHTLDLMQWIGGPVQAVKGIIDNHNHPSIEVEDTAIATLYYTSGAIGSFYGTNNHGLNSDVELEFVFEKGTFTQINEELWLTVDGQKRSIVAANKVSAGGKGYWGMGHQRCIQDAYTQIRQGILPKITLEDAFAAHELVFGIYESSRTGKKIPSSCFIQ